MCSVTNIIQRNQPASRYRRTMIYKHIALSEKSGNRRRSNRISKLIHNSRTIIRYIDFTPPTAINPCSSNAPKSKSFGLTVSAGFVEPLSTICIYTLLCQLHILIPAYIRCRILRIEFTLRNNDNATVFDKRFDGIFFFLKHFGISFKLSHAWKAKQTTSKGKKNKVSFFISVI